MASTRSMARGAARETPAFAWRKGVHLVDTAVWCDARRAQAICFLSHASVGRQPAHQQLIATPATLALLGGEAQAHGHAQLSVPYRKRFTLGTTQLELVPNGQGLGTAALYAKLGNKTVGYLGRPRALANLWGEQAEVRRVDALCVDVGEGLVERAAPPTATTITALVAAISDAKVPTATVRCATRLAAYELAHGLARAGLVVTLPKALAREGLASLPHAEAKGPRVRIELAPRVALASQAPPQARATAPAAAPAALFVVGGRGAAWPWPHGLTRAELLAMVLAAEPRELYLAGDGAVAAAAALRGEPLAHVQVRVLAPPWQMSLFS